MLSAASGLTGSELEQPKQGRYEPRASRRHLSCAEQGKFHLPRVTESKASPQLGGVGAVTAAVPSQARTIWSKISL
jgi:hypothetical protein